MTGTQPTAGTSPTRVSSPRAQGPRNAKPSDQPAFTGGRRAGTRSADRGGPDSTIGGHCPPGTPARR
ncbi:hypothetical protein HMPREF1317_0025 [Schaalia georgiae F0490]|uniref:Uncharacterized protein n=1 Tax=Schaalia georgiae F0490 TaxID=1125717 RepID=J0MW66_9ACTO|nr:hypothetical protein HMPREF1317_0025 [Schaalia georgiae F0490]